MALGGDGYWHNNYWHNQFWHVDYWSEGDVAPPPVVHVASRYRWRYRIRADYLLILIVRILWNLTGGTHVSN